MLGTHVVAAAAAAVVDSISKQPNWKIYEEGRKERRKEDKQQLQKHRIKMALQNRTDERRNEPLLLKNPH